MAEPVRQFTRLQENLPGFRRFSRPEQRFPQENVREDVVRLPPEKLFPLRDRLGPGLPVKKKLQKNESIRDVIGVRLDAGLQFSDSTGVHRFIRCLPHRPPTRQGPALFSSSPLSDSLGASMERDDDREREKLSWKEIDAFRDGTKKREKKESPMGRRQEFQKKREESQARKALEDFFQGKKSKEQEADWKKVLDGSPKNFSVRASQYVEKNGFPKQWDDLFRLLDHREASFVDQVLDRLQALSENEGRARLDLLHGKLRILKMEREEPALLSKIDAMLTAISGRL